MQPDSSSRTKILVIFGTRPEAIKLAPVIRELRARAAQFECVVCFSGQHREMGAQALAAFDLKPDIELDTMRPGQALAGLTARLLVAIDEVLEKQKPDWVMMQGDTTTAMSAALAAFYRRIRVAHVEAGLRTHDRSAPFPEEINRVFVSRVTDLHFTPTEYTAKNLCHEGVKDTDICITGNTVVDAVQWMAERLPDSPPAGLEKVRRNDERLILVTCHRRESFGEPMRQICRALLALVEQFDNVRIVLPVHPNPQVQSLVHDLLGNHPRIVLTEPLDYVPLLWCMKHAHLILTDSGGIQEEAPSFHKPILILRDTTERPEVVHAGCAQLVGTDEQGIISAASRLLTDDLLYRQMSGGENPFGDGLAAQRIADAIVKHAPLSF